MVTVKSDAGQKYRSALLESFNMRDITFLKRASWGGVVAESDRLYSTMFHDWDVLQKDCNDIEKAVKSLDWSVLPYVVKGEKVTPEAERVAKVVEDALWKQDSIAPGQFGHTFGQLLGVLCHAIWRGQNVHQIVWKSNGELVYPARFEQLLPQYLQWEMEPGKVDRLLLVQDGEAAEPKPFPMYRFIVALNNSGPDHPLYNATYYSLVAWFTAFKKGLGWFMQFCERHGLPKPVLHYDNEQDKEALIAQLADERVINAVLLEGDRQIEWATVPASGQSLPQRELLTMAEQACHKAILGQTLTSDTSTGGGSLAQAKVHAGVQADTVMRYAEFVAEVVNRQLIPAIVHFNFGRADLPMPELRCKLPQAVANIERAQFWAQVLQIPGMSVVKSDIYESLGIAMPSQGDEVISAPAQEQNALQAALQGQEKEEKKPAADKELPDNGKKDEVALAARSKEEEPAGIEGWLAPLKKKLIEAKRSGASFAELKQMMLEAQMNTRALAGAFAENIKSGFMGEGLEEDELEAASVDDCEEVEAFNQWGCNGSGHKLGCLKAKGGRESKEKNQPRLFRVDPDADPYKQKVQLAQAIEEASQDGVHLEAVINREGIGELILDCGKPGKTEAKMKRQQEEENKAAKKEGRKSKMIGSGGNGAIHAMEGRHNIDAFDIAEAIIEGTIMQDPKHPTRLNLSTDKCKVTVEREIKKGSGRISKNKFKLHTAQKN